MDSFQFDLSNSNHIAIRRLMADIFSRFFRSIQQSNYHAVQRYAGMASGLVRVSLVLLNDLELFDICSLFDEVLQSYLDYHQWIKAA